ncbi:MAG: coenzyme F420-0:L-glutamate ligase [Chloroflexota bacterium]
MLQLLAIRDLPHVQTEDDLAGLIVRSFSDFRQDDILVVAQKIVSKAEGRIVRLDAVQPSVDAVKLAAETDKDARLVELILREAREVVRTRPGLIVVEDVRGFICANAGIDRSNIEQEGDGESVALLPADPDRSARSLRGRIAALTGHEIGVIINDSHGRAFREGTVGVAIGVAGVPAVWDRRGEVDFTGYVLQHTSIGIADEIASAASLIMGPAAEGVPAVVVRGMKLPAAEGRTSDLLRAREADLFR